MRPPILLAVNVIVKVIEKVSFNVVVADSLHLQEISLRQ
jgi:hypothetical protein